MRTLLDPATPAGDNVSAPDRADSAKPSARAATSDGIVARPAQPATGDEAEHARAAADLGSRRPGETIETRDLTPGSIATSGPSQFVTRSFTNAEGTRTYKLFVPSSYGKAACALIVMLHGCTQSADDFAAGTRMNELAEERAFLVVYPEQSSSANKLKCWNWFNPADQRRDRGEPSIVAGITREIIRAYAVDPQRVYVAGMSAGASAAAVLGEAYPDLYAAVAVHSGLVCGLAHDTLSAFAAMKGGEGDRRAGDAATLLGRRIPTIVFQGDRDATVHPRNAGRFAEAMATADYDKQVESHRVPGGRAYQTTTYIDARGQTVLEQWMIHGANHAWSGGSLAGSYTDPTGPNASREIVRFFFSHRRSDG